MKTKGILLSVALPQVLILLIASNFAGAAGSATGNDQLAVSLDVTYVSKWLSKGVQAYGAHGGVFATTDIDFYGTGFGLKVVHRNSISGRHVDSQRFDYRPYYKNKLFEEQTYATNYNISIGYEHYYGRTRHKANTTYEWIFDFAWPNLLQNGIVPQYTAHYEYPVSGGDSNRKIAGWVHRFRLGYDVLVPELPNPLHLSTEVAYTDGLCAAEHDWSYFTTGLSTKFKIADNMTFVPGIYHQISMEDSVNTNDVTYAKISMKYKF